MRKVLIVGATSAIAEETARLFAKDRDRLFLVGRNESKLISLSRDLALRGAEQVDYAVLDLIRTDLHPEVIGKALQKMGGLDTVLIAHGSLPDQKACQASYETTLREIETNLLSVLSFLTLLGNFFEKQGSGTIAVISSVAGDRGRMSNYVYGSSKAALNAFLSGLRGRLYKAGVQVTTIKPGFVDTPMTAEFKKGFLWASSESVGKGIYRAIQKKKTVVYLPGFWRLIMLVIRAIPENFFRRGVIP